MRNQKLIQRKLCRWLASHFLAGAWLMLLACVSHGQEALRLSMAGDVAAGVQQQANASFGYYNLLLGPTAWRFSSGLGLEYNDNVRLESTGGNEGDVIVRPSLNAMMHWPVTLKNSLDISVAAGYSAYLQHSDLSQFFVNPGSGLSFDIYAGDFKINLHDQLAVTEEAYQNPGASGGNRDLVSLQNSAGIRALWDLNKALANVGYDHVDYVSLSQNQGVPDTSSENFYANAGIRVRPQLLLGVEAGGSVITYSQNLPARSESIPDAVQWNAGAFGSTQVSDHISVRADAGYTVYTPDNTATNLVTRDTSGFYLSLSLSHRVNKFLSYTLSAGRSTDLSAYGQAQSYYFVRLDPSWHLFQKYSLSTPLWWQQGTRIYNNQSSGGNYQQIGAGVTVGRALTKKLSASLGYQFVDETADQAGLTYTVNTVDLNFVYQF